MDKSKSWEPAVLEICSRYYVGEWLEVAFSLVFITCLLWFLILEHLVGRREFELERRREAEEQEQVNNEAVPPKDIASASGLVLIAWLAWKFL